MKIKYMLLSAAIYCSCSSGNDSKEIALVYRYNKTILFSNQS